MHRTTRSYASGSSSLSSISHDRKCKGATWHYYIVTFQKPRYRSGVRDARLAGCARSPGEGVARGIFDDDDGPGEEEPDGAVSDAESEVF